ncbi:hypothetical protein NYP18_02595 [Corynebacterium sp. YIM 101645]|uniref:Anti-sigma-D factor RsdA sigma factor binding region domain-containing protein n=1 Tax=Corynebacterium lemuris TaxID=1859292 RepID=A0ABT2FWY4_9CORY|nr:hypothetical protein [Corynebacterium lemuris]MCS5478537.1 hypothetical protein [Corynebacterium lemuris]
MKRRQKDASVGDVTSQLQPLVDDDAFLTELSRGVDPSDGTDELAALFLELRDDVEKQMPPAPLIEGADKEPEVVSLASRRRGRQGRPFLSGIIGAAAATLVIAGSGSLLYNATPDSPLWGLSSTLFSDRATVVELAGALEEIDSRAAEGDMDGTRALLEEARRLLADATVERQAPQQAPRVTTTTVIPPVEPAPPVTREPATETVTETSVQTETATVTVTQTPPPVRPNPLPIPVEPAPAPAPTNPTTPVPDPGSPDPGDQDPAPTLAPPQIQNP